MPNNCVILSVKCTFRVQDIIYNIKQVKLFLSIHSSTLSGGWGRGRGRGGGRGRGREA